MRITNPQPVFKTENHPLAAGWAAFKAAAGCFYAYAPTHLPAEPPAFLAGESVVAAANAAANEEGGRMGAAPIEYSLVDNDGKRIETFSFGTGRTAVVFEVYETDFDDYPICWCLRIGIRADTPLVSPEDMKDAAKSWRKREAAARQAASEVVAALAATTEQS